MTTLTIRLTSELLEALEQVAQVNNHTLEDTVQAALHAYVQLSMLSLEKLGEAGLLDLQAAGTYPHEGIHVTEAAVRAMTLPEARRQLMLGDHLWARLGGVPVGAALTAKAVGRQAAVAAVSEQLRGILTEAGVQRWWMRPRSRLHGMSPLEHLPAHWTPDDPEFRAIQAVAEADCGFAAT